jgi:hypothetical protein
VFVYVVSDLVDSISSIMITRRVNVVTFCFRNSILILGQVGSMGRSHQSLSTTTAASIMAAVSVAARTSTAAAATTACRPPSSDNFCDVSADVAAGMPVDYDFLSISTVPIGPRSLVPRDTDGPC